MKTAPVATFYAPAAVLPVFDSAWKDQCLTCAHVRRSSGGDGENVLRCGLAPRAFGLLGYCLTEREDGGACGVDARLWVDARRMAA